MINFRHYKPTNYTIKGFGFYLNFPGPQWWSLDIYFGKHVFVWWNKSSRMARRIQGK